MGNLQNKYSIYSGFLLLIFLNVFDGIATYIGLKNGFYSEKNIMLNYIYQCSNIMFILIKIIIPTIILCILMVIVGDKITKVIKGMIYIVNTVYAVLCIYHIGLYSLVLKMALY